MKYPSQSNRIAIYMKKSLRLRLRKFARRQEDVKKVRVPESGIVCLALDEYLSRQESK